MPGYYLIIEPGATILVPEYGFGTDPSSLPSLTVQPGAKILAAGTESSPITFKSLRGDHNRAHETEGGLWGGIHIKGDSTDAADDSGAMTYVRVRNTGANSTSGLSFHAVGSGTKVEHIEVAFSSGEGPALMLSGGTLSAKYVSMLYNDVALEARDGCKGKLQFLLTYSKPRALVPAAIISSSSGATRTAPIVRNALFVGQSIHVEGAASGRFEEVIVTKLPSSTAGVHFVCVASDNTNAVVTQASSAYVEDSNLFWSANNTVHTSGGSTQFNLTDRSGVGACDGASGAPEFVSSLQSSGEDPVLAKADFVTPNSLTTTELTNLIDPRPTILRASIASSDGWFSETNFTGAFASKGNWLEGWSWLEEKGVLASGSPGTILSCGQITEDVTWAGAPILACDVTVTGSKLIIAPGSTISIYPGVNIIVDATATLSALGTAEGPITFTTAASPKSLTTKSSTSGFWGGVSLSSNTSSLEYLRLFYSSSGLSLSGVGTGTSVDRVEVAYSQSVGVAVVGGSVNLKRVSTLYSGRSGLVLGGGHDGKVQFLYSVSSST